MRRFYNITATASSQLCPVLRIERVAFLVVATLKNNATALQHRFS